MALDLRDGYGRLIFHSDTNNADDYRAYEAARQEIAHDAKYNGGAGFSQDSQTQEGLNKTSGFFAGNGNLGRPGKPSSWW